jgi:wobble nucleotide-excising tRNase
MKMNTKMTSAIEHIVLDAATFHNVPFTPTLINFIYGNNGTGKSTIAREIGADNGITWQAGKSAADYSVLVYNQEFVDANFRNYDNLKGVFTVGEKNIEIQNTIAEKTQQKSEQDKLAADRTTEKGRKEAARETLLGNFQDSCWNKTKTIREAFDATQTGFKRKAQFADRVLQIANPTEHDMAELKSLYETAFDPNARTYREFQPLGRVTRLKDSKGNELLAKSITSSGNTPFASFIKALKATDWVRQGHEHFNANAGGKCPYCQQDLPNDFEEQLAACFDAQYKEDIDALRKFYDDYQSDMQGFVDLLKENLQDVYPKINTKEYEDKLALLEKLIEGNLQIIASKIKEPSSVVAIDNEAVKAIRDKLNELIAGFNQLIQANNSVVNAKQQKQAECKTKVWELIAFTLQSVVSSYKTSRTNLDSEILVLTKQINDAHTASRAFEIAIADLNKRIVSTAPTIKSINNLLRDSGFQGFVLREKRGQQNVYEVVRHDGQIAVNLSEGERNFIAFLYFYHLVRGSHNDADVSKDKIVVIDDPVSSMDSSVLFIVSTLVREMVEVCHNNACYLDNQVEGDYIKQIFILTHNVYFHREITYNQTHRYQCVSFFVVNKASNNSSIRLCVRPSQKIPTENENYNPVQNSYAALWSEYREVDTVIPVLNVIRRILEYYFMQLCGYDGVNVRKRVLEENKDKFVETPTEGLPDYTKYHLASAMLSYISVNSVGLSDGLNYVDDCADITLYKDVFKLIFEALQQEQHYNMMMGDEAM